MTEHAKRFAGRFQEQLYVIALFAFIFSSVSFGINQLTDYYYKHLDKTQYYSVLSPAKTVSKSYRACEGVEVVISRNALVDMRAKSLIHLTMRNKIDKRIMSVQKEIVISAGKSSYIATFKLPCDLKAGEYYFEVNVEYMIGEITKNTNYKTTLFYVLPFEKPKDDNIETTD